MMSTDVIDGPLPVFTTEEYRRRVGRIQERMALERLDALLLTSEANFRYVTGFNNQSWVNLARPRYCVVPADGDPIVVLPQTNIVAMRETSWVEDVRTWPAPRPADDGITLLVDALRGCLGSHHRFGAELGPESRLGMPVGDFLRVRDALRHAEFADGAALMSALRMIKSPAEVARCRRIAEIASTAFEALPEALRVGDTERIACRKLQIALLQRGADKSPYLIGASGRGGYAAINLGPTDRVLERGDVLIIDTGSTVDGYFCDFDREFAFGGPCDEVRRAYERVWRATEAGIAAVRPGRRCSEVWQAMAEVLGAEAVRGSNVGRMGHGIGLLLTEPPSIHPEDATVIEAGMLLTVEPGISFTVRTGSGDERKVMVHEENVAVSEDGCVLLSRRAPPEIWVVD